MDKNQNKTLIIILLVITVAAAAYFLTNEKKSTAISVYEAEDMSSKYQNPWTGLTEAIGSAFRAVTDSVSGAINDTRQYKMQRQQQAYDESRYLRSTSGLFADGILFK